MTKTEFLMKYDNKKPYGRVCYSSTLNPPCVYTSVLSVGMTKEEAEANAVKKYGKSIHCEHANNCSPIRYVQVSEAAYRKLKTAKTLNKFHYVKDDDGTYVYCYDED